MGRGGEGRRAVASVVGGSGPELKRGERHIDPDYGEARMQPRGRAGWRQGLGGLGTSRLLLTNGLAGGHGAVFLPWAHPGLGMCPSPCPLPGKVQPGGRARCQHATPATSVLDGWFGLGSQPKTTFISAISIGWGHRAALGQVHANRGGGEPTRRERVPAGTSLATPMQLFPRSLCWPARHSVEVASCLSAALLWVS